MAAHPQQITFTVTVGADTSISLPPPGRLTLSPEARRKLLGAMPVHDMLYCLADEACDDPESPDWRAIEDALLEILVPVRYVTGVPPRDTQANEHLTPKPLHEQVPGAWNFEEPKP